MLRENIINTFLKNTHLLIQLILADLFEFYKQIGHYEPIYTSHETNFS